MLFVFVRRTRHSSGFVTQLLTVSSTVDAEIHVHSLDNQGISNVLLSKPGVGQNIATHASSAASYLSLISDFHVHSNFFFFIQISNINTNIILYVNCFGRTMLYMCIEYHI